MKYCQGPLCHRYKTKDRIRGPKGYKQYETRKRSSFYYGKNNFCDQRCMYDWIDMHIERALDRFGRTTEPQYVMADSAWYKSYKYNYNEGSNSNYDHYFVNDLLGQRIPITETQYNDDNLITPSTS
jgi:hypothetical protein